MKSLRKGAHVSQAQPSDQNFSFLRMAGTLLSQPTSTAAGTPVAHTGRSHEGKGLTELALGPMIARVTAAGVVVDGFHAFAVAAA